MAVEKFKMIFVNETKGFTIVLTEVIQSIKEFDVLGLYVYLASKPESWKPNPKELMKHTGYSKDKIYKLINRLIQLGLLTSREIRDKGKFSCYEYTLHLLPCPEKPDAVSPYPENQDAYKIKNIQNKDNINISCAREKKNKESPPSYQETYYPLSPAPQESDQTFEAFWEMYPKKKSKNRARGAWLAQKCGLMVHEILAKLDEQVKKDRQFIDGYAPNPDKYILQELWNDEITPVKGANKKPSHLDHDSDWHQEFHKDRF